MKKFLLTFVLFTFIVGCFAACGEDLNSLYDVTADGVDFSNDSVTKSFEKLEEKGYKLSFKVTSENDEEKVAEEMIIAANNGVYMFSDGETITIIDMSNEKSYVEYVKNVDDDSKWVKTECEYSEYMSREQIKQAFSAQFAVFTSYGQFAQLMKKKGTENIAGRKCTKYSYSFNVLGVGMSYVYYLDNETGICLKCDIDGKNLEDVGTFSYECKEFLTSYVIEIPKDSDCGDVYDYSDNYDVDFNYSDDNSYDNSYGEDSSTDGSMKIESALENASKIDKLAKNGLLIVWKMSANGEYDEEVTISVGMQGKKYYYSLGNDEEMIYDFTDAKKCVVYSRYGEDEKWNKEEISGYSENEFKDDFYSIIDSVCSDAMIYSSSMKETGKAKIAGRECTEYKISEEYMGSKIVCAAYVDVETNIVLNTSIEVSAFGISEKAESVCTVFDTNYQIKIPKDSEIENNEW